MSARQRASSYALGPSRDPVQSTMPVSRLWCHSVLPGCESPWIRTGCQVRVGRWCWIAATVWSTNGLGRRGLGAASSGPSVLPYQATKSAPRYLSDSYRPNTALHDQWAAKVRDLLAQGSIDPVAVASARRPDGTVPRLLNERLATPTIFVE